jgi:methionyl-tRNA formyltransferase
MSEAGAPLIEETLRGLVSGKIISRPQNRADATLAPILKKEDGRIDWQRPAQEIYNRMRGFAPWPGAYTTFRGQICQLLAEPVSNQVFATQFSGKASVVPGILFAEKNALFVFCGGATVLRIQSVKLEGRKQVSASEFAMGARLKSGERFGDT